MPTYTILTTVIYPTQLLRTVHDFSIPHTPLFIDLSAIDYSVLLTGAICFFDGFVLNLKEPRVTNKGNTVQSFGLSVLTNPSAQINNEKYSIFNFVAFGDTAEQLMKDHQAGKTYAHIQGAPHIEKYVDSSGNEKKTVSFWANKISCYNRSDVIKQAGTNTLPQKNIAQNYSCRSQEHFCDEDFAF